MLQGLWSGKEFPAYDWPLLKYQKLKSHFREPFLFQISFLLVCPRRAGHVKHLFLYLGSYALPDLKGFPDSLSPSLALANSLMCSPLQQLPSFPIQPTQTCRNLFCNLPSSSEAEPSQNYYFSQSCKWDYMSFPHFFASLILNCLRSSSSHLAPFYRSKRILSQCLFAKINKSSPLVSTFKIASQFF